MSHRTLRARHAAQALASDFGRLSPSLPLECWASVSGCGRCGDGGSGRERAITAASVISLLSGGTAVRNFGSVARSSMVVRVSGGFKEKNAPVRRQRVKKSRR